MGSPTKKFTEPVALSSTQPADRPLPRRAFGLSFDLLALRARRRGNLSDRSQEVKPIPHLSGQATSLRGLKPDRI